MENKLFVERIKGGNVTYSEIVEYCKGNYFVKDDIQGLMIELWVASNDAPCIQAGRLRDALAFLHRHYGYYMTDFEAEEMKRMQQEDAQRAGEHPHQTETAPQQQGNPQAGNCEAEQAEAPQKPQKKQRGRTAKPFACSLLGNEAQKAATLKALHTVLQGKSGKDVVLILRAAVDTGKITKPTFTPVVNEFGDIGSSQNFNKYNNNKDAFTAIEIQGAIKALEIQIQAL